MGHRVFFQALTVGVLSTGLLVLTTGACTSSVEAPSAPPVGQPPPAAPLTRETPAPTAAQPLTTGRCEELGALAGSALTARLGQETESFLLPLANRPVPSRLGVTAVGKPLAELTGETVRLGVGGNDNYETCSHCIAIALDCGKDCTTATWFYPRSGSARFASVGKKFEGTFTDVVLEQVTLDWTTMRSSPVTGGACLHISELSFVAAVDLGDSGGGDPVDAGPLKDAGWGVTSSSGTSGTSSGGTAAKALEPGPST
jgi:hypothetical protein